MRVFSSWFVIWVEGAEGQDSSLRVWVGDIIVRVFI